MADQDSDRREDNAAAESRELEDEISAERASKIRRNVRSERKKRNRTEKLAARRIQIHTVCRLRVCTRWRLKDEPM